jgi:hypothetical protein
MNDKHFEFEKYDFFRSDRFVNDPYSYPRTCSPLVPAPKHTPNPLSQWRNSTRCDPQKLDHASTATNE